MDREAVLNKIEQAYAARRAGDWESLATHWHPDATYRMAGVPELIPGFPAAEARADISVPALVEMFQFHSMEPLGAVVDEKATVFRWRVVLSMGGNDPITTEILDWFELDEDGRITSLVEFADTAQIARMMGNA